MITINTKQTKTRFENVNKRNDANVNNDVDHTIELKAFGKEFVVPLKRNLNILSPFANVVDTFVDEATVQSIT